MKEIENNSLRLTDKDKEVTLYGWVQKKRDLGGVCFIDLRDRSGIVQLVAREGKCYEVASSLKSESVIKVKGIVSERESKNKNIPTGDIEVELENIELLNGTKERRYTVTNEYLINILGLTPTDISYSRIIMNEEEKKRRKSLRLDDAKQLRASNKELKIQEENDKVAFYLKQNLSAAKIVEKLENKYSLSKVKRIIKRIKGE